MSKAIWLAPFVAGAASSIIVLYSWSIWNAKHRKKGDPINFSGHDVTTQSLDDNVDSGNRYVSSSDTGNPHHSTNKVKIFDTPTLDQRVLRKAECALRKRTSRLILVIERCTNDHNYSAILRTAEALGIQHV
jgi:tRNA G18 (ribose-2'-O)-methylase SpoU